MDSVAQASAAGAETSEPPSTVAPASGSDPTIAHAGLTELDTSTKINGVTPAAAHDAVTSPPTGATGDEAGNAAGDRWDATAPGAGMTGTDESYEMVPRPQDELETPAPAQSVERSTSWADEPPAYDAQTSGNQAGESWDLKPAGEQADNTWSGGDAAAAAGVTADSSWADGAADATAGATGQDEGDGFHPVPGRHRGRGRGGHGDGEFRGRGRGRGGFRGDGEFRGRGRGGFRGGRGEGGEFRGRGGRGRGGPRGGGEGQPRGA